MAEAHNAKEAGPEGTRPQAGKAEGAPAQARQPEAAATSEKTKPQVPAGSVSPARPVKPAVEKKHEAKSLKPQTPTPGALVVEESVEIATPPEKVWNIFTEEQHWPRWNPTVRRVRQQSGERWRLGWEFEFVMKGPLLLPLKVRPVVLEVNVPRLLRWFAAAPGISAMHWFLFEKTETGTRVTSYEEFTGTLVPLLRLFPSLIAKPIRRWLQALKAECEKVAPAATAGRLPVLGAK